MSWTAYLHAIRRQEIVRIFASCPLAAFPVGLELGAGDGYQSSLLGSYVGRLVATDWDVNGLANRRSAHIEARECDAEAAADVFPAGEFDLVFSSNLLEHLPNPGAALRGVHTVLKDDGITIHVLPNPMWKLCTLALFYPVNISRVLQRLLRRSAGATRTSRTTETGLGAPPIELNPKMPPRRTAWWRHALPSPHGAYRGHLQEFRAFRKQRWVRELEHAGFRVVRVTKGPFCSGYGLGWDRLRRCLERAGMATEYCYVAVKQGRQSPYEEYFTASS